MTDRDEFCLNLRQSRLRSGLTLEVIGEKSKISPSLLAGLERGDVSRWPKGIYRRGFIREYATAIGLPPEHAVAEFCRLFPEDDGPTAESSAEGTGMADLRLVLAPDSHSWFAPNVTRVLAATLDAFIVLVVARIAVSFLPLAFWTVAGVLGLLYYTAATVCAGTTGASIILDSRRRLQSSGSIAFDVQPSVDRPRLVFRREDLSSDGVPDVAGAEGATPANLRAVSS
jgi:transcriptional regulator with XRE-family HTH domain